MDKNANLNTSIQVLIYLGDAMSRDIVVLLQGVNTPPSAQCTWNRRRPSHIKSPSSIESISPLPRLAQTLAAQAKPSNPPLCFYCPGIFHLHICCHPILVILRCWLHSARHTDTAPDPVQRQRISP